MMSFEILEIKSFCGSDAGVNGSTIVTIDDVLFHKHYSNINDKTKRKHIKEICEEAYSSTTSGAGDKKVKKRNNIINL